MLPEHAPFSPEQKVALSQLIPTFTPQQSAWLSGFLAAGSGSVAGSAAPVATKSATPLTVLYGTESGNSEMLADKTVKAAKKKGFKPKLVNMSETSPAALAQVENLLVIVSTWGDGEPPEAAEPFMDAFLKEQVDLGSVKFSVLALGDSSYEQFCETGKQVDARLAELGAERVSPRVDCDVDFDEDYDAWAKVALASLGAQAVDAVEGGAPVSFGGAPATLFDKKNPFPAEVIASVLLNGAGSAKETIHLELDLEGSGLQYEAGDALGVIPVNADDVVADVLAASGLDGSAQVKLGGEEVSLVEVLTHQLDITALSRSVAKAYLALSESQALEELMSNEDPNSFKDYVKGRQIVDLLTDFSSAKVTPQGLVDCLRKLPPRLYSIASSPKAHEGEVHLTVAAVRYHTFDRERKGVASTYLADSVKEGEKVKVYVHKNKNFRLPEDSSKPVIMVGPGTGIAPFRAFIEERGETGNEGGSWLFFGDQRYSYDFLYQLELQDHLKEGALSKLDVAFSRDQPEKVYVQDKLRLRAEEVYQWLEKGAYFYVCGDAEYMAKDVNEALISVVETAGGKSRADAEAYVAQLKKEKRYQRDVY